MKKNSPLQNIYFDSVLTFYDNSTHDTTKCEIDGQLGRNLEFIKRPRVDFWDLQLNLFKYKTQYSWPTVCFGDIGIDMSLAMPHSHNR